MNKFIIAAAAVALATPAAAQINPNQQALTVNINASVAGQCGVFNQSNIAGGNPTTTINFGDLAATSAQTTLPTQPFSVLYLCNNPAGFTRTITSANSGNLARNGNLTGALNTIPYTVQHGGGNGNLSFAAQQITAPRVNSVGNGDGSFLAGQAGSLTIRVNGVQVPSAANANFNTTSVFAGNYSDVLTVSIINN